MRAYVTLLSTRSYLDGVLVLNYSLKKVQSKYPLICLLSQGIEENVLMKLRQAGIEYILLDSKVYDGVLDTNCKSSNWDFSSWNYTFDKLYIWGLTQFEKIVFIDSDMVVFKNLDHLFERKDFTASLAGVLFPTNHNIRIMNSGLMVLTPSKDIEKSLVELAGEVISNMHTKGLPVGDQDVINAYVPNWFENKELILDDGYNLYAHYLQYYMRHEQYSFKSDDKPIYVVHYVGSEKPWMINSVGKFVKMCVRLFPNLYAVIAFFIYRKMLRKARI